MKMSVNMNHWANAPNSVLPSLNAASSHWMNAIRTAGVQGEVTVCLTQSYCLSTKAPALISNLIKCLWARHWSLRASGPCSDLLKKSTSLYRDWQNVTLCWLSHCNCPWWSVQENTAVTVHISLTLSAASLCKVDVWLVRAVYCRWKVLLMPQPHKAAVTVLCFRKLMSTQSQHYHFPPTLITECTNGYLCIRGSSAVFLLITSGMNVIAQSDSSNLLLDVIICQREFISYTKTMMKHVHQCRLQDRTDVIKHCDFINMQCRWRQKMRQKWDEKKKETKSGDRIL